MEDIQLGDLGTWIGAAGTVAAVLFAYLQGQRLARANELKERRRQAEGISSWIASSGTPLSIVISNNSGDPVYDLIVSVVLVEGAGPQTGTEAVEHYCYKTLPPGKFKVQVDYPGGGMHAYSGVEVAFTDKQEVHWIKNKNGKLRDITNSQLEYYGISTPVGWLMFDDNNRWPA